MTRICVYCGSRHGADPDFTHAARALGRSIAERGIELVYGGGHVGLMGEVADAALQAGGEVTGVITDYLVGREVAHRGLTSLEIVSTMHERKARMMELSDAFAVLPGGLGTLEELFETWTWGHMGLHVKPVGLVDVGGFWQPLRTLIEQQVAAGFVPERSLANLHVRATPDDLLDALTADLA